MGEAAPARDEERRRLIEGFLPVAHEIARRFARFGEPAEDLTQVGALALVRAVDRRDPNRLEALGAYVARCVEGEVRRHLRDRAGVVRLPRRVQELRHDPPEPARRPLPLDGVDLSDGTELDEAMIARALVAHASRALDERERRIVLLRFFGDRSQREVAAELRLSQAHVSRLLDQAMTKMRRCLEGDGALLADRGAATLRADGDAQDPAGDRALRRD